MSKTVCRTCLLESSDGEYVSLYTEINIDDTELEFCKMLYDCTGINCNRTDGLTSLICRSCTKEICSAYFFRKKCLVSQALLRVNVPETEKVCNEIESIQEEPEKNQDILYGETKPIQNETYEDEDEDDDNSNTSIITTNDILFEPDHESEGNEAEQDMEEEEAEASDKYFYQYITQEVEMLSQERDQIETVENQLLGFEEETISEEEHMNENMQIKFESELHEETGETSNEKPPYEINVVPVPDKPKLELSVDQAYSCEFCGKISLKYDTYRKHRTIHHSDVKSLWVKASNRDNVNVSSYLCDFCGMDLKSENGLQIHRRKHTGERPYVCTECGKGFTCRQYLSDHVKRHTEEIKFFCDICDKGFTRERNLQWHKKIHTDERPFTCEICQKKFLYNSKLKLHIRTHAGERPYREYEQRRKPRVRRKKAEILLTE